MDAKSVNLSKEFVDKISPGSKKLKLPINGVKKIKLQSGNIRCGYLWPFYSTNAWCL